MKTLESIKVVIEASSEKLKNELQKTKKVPEHRSGKCEFPALYSLSFCSYYADYNFSGYTILGNGINCRMPCFFALILPFFDTVSTEESLTR